jgi:hypothetical protein
VKPRRAPDLAVERFDDELVILDLAAMQLHHLNATAALAWELCDGSRRVDDVVAAVALETGMPPGAVDEAIRTTVDQLVARALLVPEPGTA